MGLKYEHGKIEIENKVFTTLDRFVTEFTKLLEGYVDYVIVSGYVVILFGRARGTEDTDTIIKHKDIEDAIYLWDIFKGKIEVNRLRGFMKALNVRGEEYGIEV